MYYTRKISYIFKYKKVYIYKIYNIYIYIYTYIYIGFYRNILEFFIFMCDPIVQIIIYSGFVSLYLQADSKNKVIKPLLKVKDLDPNRKAEQAIRRLCTLNPKTGKRKVSEEIAKQFWNGGSKRDDLIRLYLKSGGCKEPLLSLYSSNIIHYIVSSFHPFQYIYTSPHLL